jgi:lysozyme family protein
MTDHAFFQAFQFVVGEEGGYSSVASDPGNWTGGQCGAGRCAGTKFGISAAAYPTTDIAALTIEEAQALYRRDYWDRIAGDSLPPPLALLVFDAAVNTGVGRAVRWLQSVVGVVPDGVIGAATLAAVDARSGGGAAVLAEFQAQRLMFMAGLPTWRTFGAGWARRLCRLPFDAMQMGGR